MNMTAEEKALMWARKQKGNVLNNRNVDCFIAGYEMAREEYQKIIDKGYRDLFSNLPQKLMTRLEEDKNNLSYCGYLTSWPESFTRKEEAYHELIRALKSCGDFMPEIQGLLSNS